MELVTELVSVVMGSETDVGVRVGRRPVMYRQISRHAKYM